MENKGFDKDSLYRIVSMIFGTIFMVSFVMLILHFMLFKKNDENLKDVQEIADVDTEVEEDEAEETTPLLKTIDFSALQEKYPDIYAWVYVPGTLVNYPILQSGEDVDTDYYLEHNLDGTAGLPGCIYTQKVNSKDFTDRDTIVYGHNMRNDTMFGSLHNYEDETFFNEHPYIYIYTPKQNLVYQIFAAYASDDKLILDYYDCFQDDATFLGYLDDVQHNTSLKSNTNQEMQFTVEDKILTLSTCNGSSSTRYLVIGRLLSDAEVSNLGEETADSVQTEAENALHIMSGEEQANEQGE